MFNLCSIPFCFHQAKQQCIACHKSYCDVHLYAAAVQSSQQSGHVLLCEQCLQEQRPINISDLRMIHPAHGN